jgi:imidazole glycerol-phosphate synthase subunit HisH
MNYYMPNIAIIDYKMGNLHSVHKALEFMGADVIVTSNAKEIKEADKIVLPGAGAFTEGMDRLHELGLVEILNEEVIENKKPFLGICLGMHLAASVGEEGGEHEGLGWVDARVVRFDLPDKSLKIPHMGWDDVEFKKESPIFGKLKSPTTFYFVHSYHFVPENKVVVTGVCDYGGEFVAAVQQENIFLTQFHPEKSQKKGLKVLDNFINL